MDVAVYCLLSAKGIAPPCYGIMPGVGRLEEWVLGSRPLRTAELVRLPPPSSGAAAACGRRAAQAEAETSASVARALAELHTVSMPLDRSGRWLPDSLDVAVAAVRGSATVLPAMPGAAAAAWCAGEVEWLLPRLAARERGGGLAFELVLCHNDLQEGNILHHADGSISLIDFEYAGYNHCGFDVANHWREWCFEYGEAASIYTPENYPSPEAQAVRNRAPGPRAPPTAHARAAGLPRGVLRRAGHHNPRRRLGLRD